MTAEKAGEIGWIDRLVNWEGNLPLSSIREETALVVDENRVATLMIEMLSERDVGGRCMPAGQIDPIIVVQLDPRQEVFDVAHGHHRVVVRARLHRMFPDSSFWKSEVRAKAIRRLKPEKAFEVLWQLRGQGIAEHERVALPRIIQCAENTWILNPLSKKVDFTVALAFAAGLRTEIPGLDKTEIAQIENVFGNVTIDGLWGQTPDAVLEFINASTDVDREIVLKARPGHTKDLVVDLVHPERSELPIFLVPLLARYFPGKENFVIQQVISRKVLEYRLTGKQIAQLCESASALTSSRAIEDVVRIINSWTVNDFWEEKKRGKPERVGPWVNYHPDAIEIRVLRNALTRALRLNYMLFELLEKDTRKRTAASIEEVVIGIGSLIAYLQESLGEEE